MKRALFVFLGLTAALTVVGLLVVFARPVNWPANIRPLAWRRAIGEAVDRSLEEEVAA
jgi:hypothetical protein